jgi:DNA-binding transcriptional LysR family regulator
MTIENRLTVKQLRAFVAVYRAGKLAAAAERLSITQGAVSVLIRQIETTLGAKLFDRSTRSLKPTGMAHEAIGPAERILGDVAALGASFQALGERRRGRVHVAVTPAVGTMLMPAAVRQFSQTYPDIQIVFDDCAPDQFLPLVTSGRVEFGIGTPEPGAVDIETVELLQDRLCVVCPSDHALASKRQVRWAELEGVPLVAIRQGYGVRRMIDTAANGAGIALNIVNEVSFLTTALWMVSSGLGATIFPHALVAGTHANLVTRPLVSPVIKRSICVVTQRGRSLSPACQSFVDVLRQTLPQQQRSNREALRPTA